MALDSKSSPMEFRCVALPLSAILRDLEKKVVYCLCILFVGMIGTLMSLDVRADPEHTKRAIATADYDRWRHIEAPILSDDGKWVAYSLSRTVEGGRVVADLVVRSTQSTKEFRVERGLISIPVCRGPGCGSPPEVPTQITADSRFVIFSIAPVTVETEEEDSQSKPTSVQLGIMRLPDGHVIKIPGISSFVMPSASGRHLAYQLRSNTDHSNRTLVVRELHSGQEIRIADVEEYSFEKRGRYLAYAVLSSTSGKNSVHVRRVSDGHTVNIVEGSSRYQNLTFDGIGEQLAFLAQDGEAGAGSAVYHAMTPLTVAKPVVETGTSNSLHISAGAGVRFTEAGNALIFGMTTKRKQGLQPLNAVTEVALELWHWQRYGFESSIQKPAPPIFTAIYHIDTGQWTLLGNERTPDVLVNNDASHGFGVDQKPYDVRKQQMKHVYDLYSIDTRSGQSKLLRREFGGSRQFGHPLMFSPSGNYFLFYENERWFSYSLNESRFIDLTGRLPPSVFFGYSYDPRDPGRVPVGIAGWTENDERVLIYDRNDIWEIDPSGVVPPRSLTEGLGRRTNTIFRLWPVTPHMSTLGRATNVYKQREDILLTAIDNNTMAFSIWRDRIGVAASPKQLLQTDKWLTPVASAREAGQYLLTQESFTEFPDLWTGKRFDTLKKLSNANPHQAEYHWGRAELIQWKSEFGALLKGILYKPENFNPSKKYPMIVNYYDEGSYKLHRYHVPGPHRRTNPNPATFVSKGYLVFIPDTLPIVPYPGRSALASVQSGVKAVIERGGVDPARIGISGFSFGGYETNYIATQTDMFRCISSGAGVTNLTSIYGVHPHGAGYAERYQQRLGESLKDRPFVYLENSPLFYLDRVQAPMLILHNEDDHAVHFEQGIELINGLRRNGKEAYLFNYKGEGHGLSQYANIMDWDRRYIEFFDHCLMSGPRPRWMEHGLE